MRCSWVKNEQIYIDYHDREWGRPQHNDVCLFEMLVLESMQAGLSWLTVLRKREAFRAAFAGFDPQKVATFDEQKIAELLQNSAIIRHRGKIVAAINNARCFCRIQEQYGSFDRFIWQYVNFKPLLGKAATVAELPARTELSDRISKDLQKAGFKFVGSTIVYSFMQAVGMVNDHLIDCEQRLRV